MTAILHTSTHFACTVADGADWREIGRKILESVESIRTPDDGMNVGFIYATDALAPEFGSLVSLLKNITRIPHWFGATGSGICGNGISLAERPAATVLIGKLPENSFKEFTLPGDFNGILPQPLRTWLSGHQTSVALTHGLLCAPAARALDILRDKEGLFSVGGFSSGRTGGLHIASAALVSDRPVSGVLLDDTTRVMIATAQGCLNAGPAHEITECRENVITQLGGRPAFDVLKESVDQIALPDGVENQRKGHIHAAFPVPGMDTGALLVRNITRADEEDKTLTVAHPVSKGDAVQFVYRDRRTALEDLSTRLRDLHNRACRDAGVINMRPKALLYFGCGARLPDLNDQLEPDPAQDEAALIHDIFGDIPTAGFYTAAEICNGHVYGYTGVAVLIL